MFQDICTRPGFVPPTDPKVIFIDKSWVASTAYSLQEQDAAIRELLSSLDFKPGDEMWFVFGEIDVRFQVYYQHQQLGIPLDQSIEDMTTRYTNYVKTLVDLGYPIKIVSITPTQFKGVPDSNGLSQCLHLLNPMRGEGITLEHRIYMTEELNKRLWRKCFKLGIGFIDLYPYLVDPDTGCIRMDLTKDNGMHCYYIGDWVIENFDLGGNNGG